MENLELYIKYFGDKKGWLTFNNEKKLFEFNAGNGTVWSGKNLKEIESSINKGLAKIYIENLIENDKP